MTSSYISDSSHSGGQGHCSGSSGGLLSFPGVFNLDGFTEVKHCMKHPAMSSVYIKLCSKGLIASGLLH